MLTHAHIMQWLCVQVATTDNDCTWKLTTFTFLCVCFLTTRTLCTNLAGDPYQMSLTHTLTWCLGGGGLGVA